MAETERVKRHLDIFDRLQADRSVWDTHYEDLARVMLPSRMGFASTQVPGSRRVDELFDGTPMQAARGLRNAMGGMMRPDGEDWFFLTLPDAPPDDEATTWIADAEERLRAALLDPKARFRQATGECDLDLVVFGTGIVYVGESKRMNSLLFQCLNLKDSFPFFDEEGNADGMYRVRWLTAQQAVDKFGLGNVSEQVRLRYREAKYQEKFRYLHCVTRRDTAVPGAALARNFAFTDLWIDMDAKEEAHDGGFREFPFVVPRWDTSSGEDYGRSPGMIALPDANTAQAMGETLLVAGQRAADPPFGAPADGAFHELNTAPGMVSYYDPETVAMVGRNPFFPLISGENIPLTREMQNDTREQIFRSFLRNVLNLPVDGPEMTATEVMQRKEEFLREIGPVFGRLETDYTAPMVERGFRILLRAGALPPIPPSLAGKAIRIEYESPVKRIKQQVEARAAQLWTQEAIAIGTAQKSVGMDPTAMDVPNFDEALRFGAEAVSLPSRLLNGKQAVAAQRQARQQARDQANKLAMAQQVAETAQTGADAMGKAGLVPNQGQQGQAA